MNLGRVWADIVSAALHCPATDTWVGDGVRQASSGAVGRRLLEAGDAWEGDGVRQARGGRQTAAGTMLARDSR